MNRYTTVLLLYSIDGKLISEQESAVYYREDDQPLSIDQMLALFGLTTFDVLHKYLTRCYETVHRRPFRTLA